MADDKSKQDNRDRVKVAGDEDYEVQYLADTARITPDQARGLIKQHGSNRETLLREAKKIA